MSKCKITKSKGSLFTWLMGTMLLLSLFTFSGRSAENNAYRQQATQTEIRVGNISVSYRTISVKKFLTKSAGRAFHASICFQASLYHRQRAVSAQLPDNTRQVISFSSLYKVTPYTPRAMVEGLASLRG